MHILSLSLSLNPVISFSLSLSFNFQLSLYPSLSTSHILTISFLSSPFNLSRRREGSVWCAVIEKWRADPLDFDQMLGYARRWNPCRLLFRDSSCIKALAASQTLCLTNPSPELPSTSFSPAGSMDERGWGREGSKGKGCGRVQRGTNEGGFKMGWREEVQRVRERARRFKRRRN